MILVVKCLEAYLNDFGAIGERQRERKGKHFLKFKFFQVLVIFITLIHLRGIIFHLNGQKNALRLVSKNEIMRPQFDPKVFS